MNKVNILGVKVDKVTIPEAADKIMAFMKMVCMRYIRRIRKL